ncbi:NUDIX hydrolase [Companilactobacillus pabuli]|jgi:ADP-ribose pyrophosphatase YjhB (NUDIX family)|nr:NUDIX hydrolase N-terminal domain-containing protein [Companilactobacillus pabuli]AKP04164.1 ADP-ribose pyrophosphatase [Companilactobacillus farciminis]AKS52470.1 ADP-ribose pyrophosphatase [Companilactobacillus farciminis]MDG5113500.1 NUDIX hydrolase N-terminal domain-containing protein [Companilactobacillus pabuli]GAQ01722.1 ADP-ribose pyrophosphatase [Companilactobacillus farciminis]
MDDIELLIEKLQAIAQTGKHYSKDVFDRERYDQLEDVSKQLITKLVKNPSQKRLNIFFDADTGYVTPKVDIRAATFRDNKILLVREKSSGEWSIPGGWGDVGYSAAEIAVKETFEEAGIKVKPKRMIAIKDMQKNHYPKKNLNYVYKLFFECIPTEDDIHSGVETSDVRYFTLDEALKLNLSLARNMPDDFKRAFACHKADNWETYFD